MTATPKTGFAVIAEDEESGRLLLAESASAAGLEPLVFDNGIDAFDCVVNRDVAIVLLDVEMPGLDGYAVCRRLRSLPRLASVPIVMVTGQDDKTAINRAFEAGATDFISKPVSWALLPHRLEYILRNAASVRALADRETKLRTLFEAIPDSLWVVSATGEPRWNPNAEALVHSPQHGKNTLLELSTTLPEDFRPEVLTTIGKTAADGIRRRLEFRDAGPANTSRSAELRFSRCEGGDVLVVRQDTSARTAAAERIEKLAYFDTLTGLPNRQRFIDTTTAFLECAASSKDGIALIYIDLNGFKRINDAFGHSAGDAVLTRVAAILSRTLERFERRASDVFLARLGGDEFVMLIASRLAREAGLELAAACCRALEEPIIIDCMEFLATPSIGVAVYPEDGNEVETLLKHADTAMYQAKAAGAANVVAYSPAMSAWLRDTLDIESRLRRAVRDERLQVRYQPKFRLVDGKIVGVEALTRWYDPEHGEISPHRFIAIAEESNLIIDLGAWLISEVCRQLRGWLDLGIAIPIAINVSGKELLFGDPARVIEAEARKWCVPTSLIEIEITESVFVTDSTVARNNVDKLRGLGCCIALDDFGTGYSSLAYLTRFPPDRVKIDKSFVQNVDSCTGDAAVVIAITSLAKTLGMTVTAEGVERRSQLEWLRSRGCDEIQGFLLARPMSGADVESQFLMPVRFADVLVQEQELLAKLA